MRKPILLALAILLLFAPYTQAQGPTKPPSRPPLDKLTAVQAILRNDSLNKGHVYLLSDVQHFSVRQNLDNGLLLSLNTGMYLGSMPDGIILQTTKHYADQALLPVPTCGIYNGLTQYTTVTGANATVHKFSEVSCKGYVIVRELALRKATSVSHVPTQSTKPKSSTVAQVPTTSIEDPSKNLTIQNYTEDVAQRVMRNWSMPRLELKSSDKPIVISAVILSNGQIFNTKIEESSEPLGMPAINIQEKEDELYYYQMNAYYHQNHGIVDNSAKMAIDTVILEAFNGTLPRNAKGLSVKFTFNTMMKQVLIPPQNIKLFIDENTNLVKTPTIPITITYQSKPKLPLTPEQKAFQQQNLQYQQQQQREQQAREAQARQFQVQSNIFSGFSLFNQMLPLIRR